jgi:hypothetical protein
MAVRPKERRRGTTTGHPLETPRRNCRWSARAKVSERSPLLRRRLRPARSLLKRGQLRHRRRCGKRRTARLRLQRHSDAGNQARRRPASRVVALSLPGLRVLPRQTARAREGPASNRRGDCCLGSRWKNAQRRTGTGLQKKQTGRSRRAEETKVQHRRFRESEADGRRNCGARKWWSAQTGPDALQQSLRSLLHEIQHQFEA